MFILKRQLSIILSGLLLLIVEVSSQEKVALVLSGGGAQGMAHIGVFKAFEEYNIPIDLIVGSSAGALVGGLYAAGITVEEMENMVGDGTIEHLFTGRPKRLDLPIWERDERYFGNFSLGIANGQFVAPTGLLDDRLIWKELFLRTASADFHAGWDFDSLFVPFRAVASDLRKKEPFEFSSGPLANALRSSMSIPMIYSPIQRNGQVLVDGGIYLKLPVEIALKEKADFIIAVSAEDAPDYGPEVTGLGGMFEVLNSHILASGDSVDVQGWDYFFRVPTGGHHVLDFPAGEALMEAGYIAGTQAAVEIVKILEQKGYETERSKSRDGHRYALDGKLLALNLESQHAGFDPEMIRRKLKLADSLRFNQQRLDDLIDEVYATDIYQAVIPSLDQAGETLALSLLEKPDIRTRGRLDISSTEGMTLFTRTDMPMSRFGGLVQLDAAFGNRSGGIQLAAYPVSYHKTGARLPFSIRPAVEFSTRYHNYDLPGVKPLADRIHAHELSVHSASIGGWDRQMILVGGVRSDDPGQILLARPGFEFMEQFDKVMPFVRIIFEEDHIKRDRPNVEGWRIGFQSDWIWQDELLVNQHHLWTTCGSNLAWGWSGTTALDYYSGDPSLPIFTMGQVVSPKALSEKYYMYNWTKKVLNVSLQTAHRLFRDDLRAEITMIHSRFQDPVWHGLDQYERSGLSAVEISINYLTIIGNLSVGWSFSELEDYRGTSWTEIGLTL